MGLLTSASIVCSSFLLGILFTSLLWDATVLFPSQQVNEQVLEAVELYYLTWWNAARTVKVAVLFLSIIAKFARKSDTSFYFSGASLFLLVLCMSLYIIITLPSIRNISKDPINTLLAQPVGYDTFTRLQAYFAKNNPSELGDRARAHVEALNAPSKMTWTERLEHDAVLCASNGLAMLLLAGVILLQVTEWYLDETIVKEAQLEEAAALQPQPAAPAVAVTQEKKTQ
ncbi:hypothetical protein OIO90_001269 [Microbotryomycetes sp. JL221]|nr:hypothetical protein OIO90_001269 [Microbotryomycetes sp. JL221]